MEYPLSQFNSAPVRLWKLEEGAEIKLYNDLGVEAWTVAFSRMARWSPLKQAIRGERNPRQFWNSQIQETLALQRAANHRTAPNPPRQLSFSSDGALLVCDNGLASQFELWGVRHKNPPGS
jgi:hypothetical protein